MLIRMFTALMLLVASLSINAAPIETPIVFTLDATFEDGGTATGTLTLVDWSSERSLFDDVSITTTYFDESFPGSTYVCEGLCDPTRYFDTADSEDSSQKVLKALRDGATNFLIRFAFAGDLSQGGTFLFENNNVVDYGEQNDSNKGPLRRLASGSITSTAAVTLEEQLEALSALIVETNANAGISNALDSKLNRVFAALDDTNENNDGAALNSMYAFCSSIDAQRGKKLTEEQAVQLIEAGNGIISSLDEFAPLCE